MVEKSENVRCLNVLMEVRWGGGSSGDPDYSSILLLLLLCLQESLCVSAVSPDKSGDASLS